MTYPLFEAVEKAHTVFADQPQYIFPMVGDIAEKGFTISAEAYRSYLINDELFPDGLWDEIGTAVGRLEQQTLLKFDDWFRPLLLTCHTLNHGGVMTPNIGVENIGLNDRSVSALIASGCDARLIYEAYARLLRQFGNVVKGVPEAMFDAVIHHTQRQESAAAIETFSAETWRILTYQFKNVIYSYSGDVFPYNPFDQLYMTIEALFDRCAEHGFAAASPLLAVQPIDIASSKRQPLQQMSTILE